jgi:hypothetical protein
LSAAADRAAAIDDLPPVYGRVVRLVDAGCDLTTVARRLDLDPESVAPLLEIAEAKLTRLLQEDPS